MSCCLWELNNSKVSKFFVPTYDCDIAKLLQNYFIHPILKDALSAFKLLGTIHL